MEEERPKLLIVDDEHNTREAMARYLGRRYRVTTAADGGDALEKLAGEKFDLVLTDLRMPKHDGMEVLEVAKAQPDPPSCVLLTAYGSDDDRLAQRALVASDIARIMDRFSILIVERKHVDRDNIDSTAVVSNEELKKIDAPEELTDLVASRGSRR